jgi:hypothetical protein
MVRELPELTELVSSRGGLHEYQADDAGAAVAGVEVMALRGRRMGFVSMHSLKVAAQHICNGVRPPRIDPANLSRVL